MQWTFADDQHTHQVLIQRQADDFTIYIGAQAYHARVLQYRAPRLTLLVDDRHVIESDVEWKQGGCRINVDNIPYYFQISTPRHAVSNRRTAEATQHVRAPLPGRIVAVLVQAGEQIRVGQPVCVIEAMKMQNEICAGTDGVVQNICVRPGSAVDGDAVLITVTSTQQPRASRNWGVDSLD